MVVLANRVKVATATTGTSDIVLGSAVTGYQSFADGGVSDGETVRYTIEDGDNWEIGTGTYTHATTTLSRTVLESNNSDNEINLSGDAVVFITAAADDIVPSSGGTFSGNVSFGDNDKAIFGASSDLQIYHDGSNSYVSDSGTGALHLKSTGGGVKVVDNNDAVKFTVAVGTGDVSVTGTVDGRDIAADGTKLDGIETGATADQTAAEILTAIKTVDGSGSGLDADLLDGQQGSYYLNTSTTFGGDVSGTYDAIVVANDSHTHTFDNLTAKAAGTGDYATTGDLQSGKGSGGVALTINDGGGNANVTFNHKDKIPEQNGQCARIEVNTDNTTSGNAQMYFELGTGTSGTVTTLTNVLTLYEDSIDALKPLDVTGNITVSGTVDGVDIAGSIDQAVLTTSSPSFAGLTVDTDVLYVDSTNDRVGVNKTNPAYEFDVTGNARVTSSIRVGNYIYHDGDTNSYLGFGAADDFRIFCGGRQLMRCDEGADPDILQFMDANNYTTSAGNWNMSGNVSANQYTATSDITLKENLLDIDGALQKISQINGYTYNFIKTPELRNAGLVAQEVEKVVPEAVTENSEGIKSIDYNGVIALLVSAIKEQQAEIDLLKEKIGA